MSDVVENPMLATGTTSDLAAAVGDGATAAPAAQATLEERLLGMEKQLADHQNTRGMIAWFTETTPNWHQMAIFYQTSPHPEDEEMRKRSPLLFAAGCVMLFVQAATAVSIDMGSNSVSCATGTNSACPAHQICNSDALRCQWCGGREDHSNATAHRMHVEVAGWRCSAAALDSSNASLAQCLLSDHLEAAVNCPSCVEPTACELPEGTVLPEYDSRYVFNDYGQQGCPAECFRAASYHGASNDGCYKGCDPRTAWEHGLQDRINWCTGCWDEATSTFDTANGEGREKAFVDGMGPFDWCALYLAAALVALTVVAELKDVLLCKFALQHAIDAGQDPGKGWRFAYSCHRWVRRWIFIPALIQCVPRLIGTKGGDALNVSLNTVAVRKEASLKHCRSSTLVLAILCFHGVAVR